MNDGPKLTIGGKNKNGGFGSSSFTPGPGNYNLSNQNHQNSGVTIGGKYHSNKQNNEEPGPGSYNNNGSQKKIGAKIGNSKRSGLGGYNYTPGPG